MPDLRHRHYLQIEIEYDDTVLVDTPAWIANSIMPVAFALMAYRYSIGALQQAGDLMSEGAVVSEE